MATFNGKIVEALPPLSEYAAGEYVQLVSTDGEGHYVVTEYRHIGSKWSAIRTSTTAENIGQLYQSSILGLESALAAKQDVSTLTKETVGLGNVDNVAQARVINYINEGKLLISGFQTKELIASGINIDDILIASDIENTIPSLVNGKIPIGQIPFSSIVNRYEVPDIADLEGIVGVSQGDIIDVINDKRSYIYSGGLFFPLKYPVTSVNGLTGPVTLSKATFGLDNVTNDAQVKKATASTIDNLVVWANESGSEVKNSSVQIGDILVSGMLDIDIPTMEGGLVKNSLLDPSLVRTSGGKISNNLLQPSIPIKVDGVIANQDIPANLPRMVNSKIKDEDLSANVPLMVNGKIVIENLPDTISYLDVNGFVSQENIPPSVAQTEETGKLNTNLLPSGTFFNIVEAASESAMVSLGIIPKHTFCFRSDINKVFYNTNVNPNNVSYWRLFGILDERTFSNVADIYNGLNDKYITSTTLNAFFDDFFTLDINNFPTVNPTLTYFFSRGIPLSSRFDASYLGDFKKVLRKSNGGAYLSNKIDLDYSGSGICKGLFMEQSDFNYLKGSYDFTTVDWVKDNGTVSVQSAGGINSFIDGSATHAFTVQTDGIINSISQVKSLNDVSRSFSIFLKRTNNRYVLLHLFDNDVTSTFLKVYVDLIEGTATVLGTGIGNPSNLVSHVETVDKFDNRWLKVSIDIVEAVVSIDTFAIKLVNGLAETPYPLAGSSVLLANASLSQHGTKTIIPNLNQSQVNNYNFTFSATDLDFINTTEGCFLFEFIFYNISLMNTNDLDQQIFRIGTSTDNLELYYDDSANSLVLSTVNNSVTSSVSKSLAGISKGNDSIIRVAFNYVREESNTDVAEGLLEISVNGTSTASNATVPYLVDFANKTMYLCNKNGSSHFSGWLREIVYYPKAQSNLNLLSKVSQ